MGDLNACASQLDHGYTITDANFFASNWSKWIRGMLGLDSSHPPRCVAPALGSDYLVLSTEHGGCTATAIDSFLVVRDSRCALSI